MKWTSRLLALGLAAFSVSSARAQVMVGFENPSDLSDHFRTLSTRVAVQSSNGAANDYIVADQVGGSAGSVVLLYDTTPGDATAGTQSVFDASGDITVSFDFVLQSAGSSIGVWFADPNDLSRNILALVNLDNTGANDQFRFFKNGTLTSGSPGTQVGSSVLASSGINIGSPFSTFSLTLSQGEGIPELSLTLGSQTIPQPFSDLGFDFSNGVVVALRLFDNSTGTGNGVLLDNFEVQTVPEPSAALLLLLGGVGLFALRAWSRERRH